MRSLGLVVFLLVGTSLLATSCHHQRRHNNTQYQRGHDNRGYDERDRNRH